MPPVQAWRKLREAQLLERLPLRNRDRTGLVHLLCLQTFMAGRDALQGSEHPIYVTHSHKAAGLLSFATEDRDAEGFSGGLHRRRCGSRHVDVTSGCSRRLCPLRHDRTLLLPNSAPALPRTLERPGDRIPNLRLPPTAHNCTQPRASNPGQRSVR